MAGDAIKIKVREERFENLDLNEINWRIEERQMNLENNQWLWALAIVGFAIVVFSILLKNYLLIIVIALSTFIIYASKNKKSESHYFRLDNEGVTIDGKLYSYGNFESFWIFPAYAKALADEPVKEIAFRRKHHLMPLLIIPFHNSEETEIRKILESHLPENEEEGSFLDLLQKKFF